MKSFLKVFLLLAIIFSFNSFSGEMVNEVPVSEMEKEFSEYQGERVQADFDEICFIGGESSKRCKETLEVLNLMSNERVLTVDQKPIQT